MFFHDGAILTDPTGFAAASVLLRLAATIAEADDSVDEKELGFINEHLQGQFNLSEAESKRLDRLQYLLLHSRSGDNAIGKAIAKKLPLKHRRLVGEFLVGVAASDGVICKAEVKALRKAYRSLELDESDLDPLLRGHEESKTSERTVIPEELQLDLDAVSRIMAETRQVASLLRDAMAEDDDAEDGDSSDSLVQRTTPRNTVTDVESRIDHKELVAEVISSNDKTDFLDARYRPLLQAMLAKNEWSMMDLRKVAEEHGLMLAGAIEAINEWSTEHFGDWLVEEGDAFIIHKQLLEENS